MEDEVKVVETDAESTGDADAAETTVNETEDSGLLMLVVRELQDNVNVLKECMPDIYERLSKMETAPTIEAEGGEQEPDGLQERVTDLEIAFTAGRSIYSASEEAAQRVRQRGIDALTGVVPVDATATDS
jgi:phage-related tail protein